MWFGAKKTLFFFFFFFLEKDALAIGIGGL